MIDLWALMFGKYPAYKPPGPERIGAHTVTMPGAPDVGEAPYAMRTVLSGADFQMSVLKDWVGRTTWPEHMSAGGVEAFRVPRTVMLNIGNLAGLSGVDGVNQTGHDVFLPPLRPDHMGTTQRAMSGGGNRATSGSGIQSREPIAAVFVPVGRGD